MAAPAADLPSEERYLLREVLYIPVRAHVLPFRLRVGDPNRVAYPYLVIVVEAQGEGKVLHERLPGEYGVVAGEAPYGEFVKDHIELPGHVPGYHDLSGVSGPDSDLVHLALNVR